MQTLNKLLDAARTHCPRDSDAAVAEQLKVSRTTLMQWRTGERRITDEHLAALLQLAKADEATFVRVREEMAGSPAERKTWRSLLDRMGAAVVVVAVGAVAVVLAHPGAHEGIQAALPLLVITEPLYIMRNCVEGRRSPAALDLALDQDLPTHPATNR